MQSDLSPKNGGEVLETAATETTGEKIEEETLEFDPNSVPVANAKVVTFQIKGIEFKCPQCRQKAQVMSPEVAGKLQKDLDVFGKCDACQVICKIQLSRVLSRIK